MEKLLIGFKQTTCSISATQHNILKGQLSIWPLTKKCPPDFFFMFGPGLDETREDRREQAISYSQYWQLAFLVSIIKHQSGLSGM